MDRNTDALTTDLGVVHSVVPVLRPLKQGRAEWFQESLPPNYVARMGYPIERWIHYGTDITVLTAVEVATDKDGSSNGPEYHVSVSRATWPNGQYKPARIDTNAAKWVLAEFGLDGAEEDNHVPNGVVRNFWRPMASGLVGKECRCKAEEVVIKEMKGDFIWRP
jgi:hypothetical protein